MTPCFVSELQIGPVHFPCRDAAPVGEKSSLFEPLGSDAEAGTVPVENFHLRRPDDSPYSARNSVSGEIVDSLKPACFI